MRHSVLLLLATLIGLAPARADEATDVQAVITRQLDAFAHDDADAAYGFAAPEIREKFADASTFLSMVKTVYPAVYRHRSAQFGAETHVGERARQDVTLIDADNVVWSGVYVLARQSDGDWRIEACILKQSDETSL